MAAPAYATDLTPFWLAGATTITALGGGGMAAIVDTDTFIQGVDCVSGKAFTNSTKGFIIDALGTTFTVPTDGAVIGFCKYDAVGSLSNQSGGGMRFLVGSGAAAYDEFYCGGADTLAFASWTPFAIDPNTATPDVSNSGGAERWVGMLCDLPTSSGPTKGNPIQMDSIRYGRCTLEYTIGDITTPATFDGMELAGNVNSTRWGLLELLNGALQTQGFHSIGLSGTACYFVDADQVLFWRALENNITDDAVSANFNRVEIIHASTVVDWTNIIWSALGTRARGQFVHASGTCHLHVCQFFGWDTFSLLAATVITDSLFARCNAITAPGTDMTGTQILVPTVVADSAGLVWDVATNPNGKLDNMIFSKGSADHHAIDFGTNVTSDITLTGIEFTDFVATDDHNGAALRFLATSGSLQCNMVGCTVDGVAASASNFAVDDAAGIAVTLAFDSITLSVTVLDATDDTPLTTAHVQLLKDSDKSVLLSGTVNGSGVISDSITYDADTDVVGWAREHNMAGTDYTQQDFSGQYTSNGFSIVIRLEPAE
jgi:hypothetical protein